jgi:hypothetical protein
MPIIEVVQRLEVPDRPDIELLYDDGEPLETNWYRLQINLPRDMLHQHWPERTDFFEEAAESAHTRAETERARAETERARAEPEHARAEALEAENTRLRAELERLRGSTP